MKIWHQGNYLGDYKIMSVNNNPYALDNRTTTASRDLEPVELSINEVVESLLVRTNNQVCRLGDMITMLTGIEPGFSNCAQPEDISLRGKLKETGYNITLMEERLKNIESILGLERKVEMGVVGKSGR